MRSPFNLQRLFSAKILVFYFVWFITFVEHLKDKSSHWVLWICCLKCFWWSCNYLSLESWLWFHTCIQRLIEEKVKPFRRDGLIIGIIVLWSNIASLKVINWLFLTGNVVFERICNNHSLIYKFLMEVPMLTISVFWIVNVLGEVPNFWIMIKYWIVIWSN